MKKLIKNIFAIFSSGWKCPQCGGTNTESGIYYDMCKDCDYFQGY